MTSIILSILLSFTFSLRGMSAETSASETRLMKIMQAISGDAREIYPVSLGQAPSKSLSPKIQTRTSGRTASSDDLVRREFGGVIAENSRGEFELQSIVEGSENSLSVYTGGLASGTRATGEFHTHPWKYPQLKNVAFSPRDIVNMYHAGQSFPFFENYFYVVLAGDEFFILNVEDTVKAKVYFQSLESRANAAGKSLNDFVYSYFYSFNQGDSIQDITNHSIRQTVGKSVETGIFFYRYGPSEKLELLNP